MNTSKLATWLSGPKLVVSATLATLLLLAPIAALVSGTTGFVAVLVSVAACGVPGLLSLALWRAWSRTSVGLLCITFARMGLGLLVAGVAKLNWPNLLFGEFYVWLAIVYMVSLAVDTVAVQHSMAVTASTEEPA